MQFIRYLGTKAVKWNKKVGIDNKGSGYNDNFPSDHILFTQLSSYPGTNMSTIRIPMNGVDFPQWSSTVIQIQQPQCENMNCYNHQYPLFLMEYNDKRPGKT